MLTLAQKQLLKADILADTVLAEWAATGRMAEDIANVYNLTVGKARIWDWMTKLGTFDASKPNIRAGIDASWVGTAQDLAVRATVYTHCKRDATRGEKLLSTGTGTTASPATMGWEGFFNYQDIEAALQS